MVDDRLRELELQLSAAQGEVAMLREAYEATDALLNSVGVSGACLLAANHGYTVTPEQQALIDRVTRAKEAFIQPTAANWSARNNALTEKREEGDA